MVSTRPEYQISSSVVTLLAETAERAERHDEIQNPEMMDEIQIIPDTEFGVGSPKVAVSSK